MNNNFFKNLRKVRVTVERTFRGKLEPKPRTIESTSYKADYRLIPKDEEESYCRKIEVKTETPILQKTMEFPPLMRDVLIREKKAKGEDVQDLKLDIVYNKHVLQKSKLAEDGEKPTVTIQLNMQQLPNLSLYKNIKLSTETK